MKIIILAVCVLIGALASPVSAQWQKGDVRSVKLLDENSGTVKISNGMTAARDGDSIVVDIPGAYLDTLAGYPVRPLTLQLAAAALVGVCDVPVRTGAEAIKTRYKGSHSVRQGSGEVFTEYAFLLGHNRNAKVFVYLNDISGLTAVIKMPASR